MASLQALYGEVLIERLEGCCIGLHTLWWMRTVLTEALAEVSGLTNVHTVVGGVGEAVDVDHLPATHRTQQG